MSGDIDIFDREFRLSSADADLARLYGDIGVTVDRLAYTDHFEELYRQYRALGHDLGKTEVFRRLLMLRKVGLLPRLFRTAVAMAGDD